MKAKFLNQSIVARLSRLCREFFPGQADDVDFFEGWLVRLRWPKSCGDEDPAELGGHVGGRWLGLGGVPGSAGAVIFDVGGVMPGGGVPGGGDGLAGELERDGALDGAGGAVAGLACAEDLAGVLDRDLDAPPGGIPLDDLREPGAGVGGDQGHVVPGRRGVTDQHDLHGPGAEDAVPQAGDSGGVHGGGLAVAGDGDRDERRGGGEPGPGTAACLPWCAGGPAGRSGLAGDRTARRPCAAGWSR